MVASSWLVAVLLASQAAAQDTVPVKETYTYKKVGDIAIQADVYRYKDDQSRPVLVWIHGGALINGSRTAVPRNLLDLSRKEGYILVSLDYRLAPEVKLPAIIEDVDDAFRWLHKEGPRLIHADTKKVVVAGGSAGGYLTMLAGTRVQPRPQALVAYWGYGDVDGPWYTHPSEHYRKAVPLIDREEALKGVNEQVLTGTDGTTPDRQARGRYYLYLRQNGLWTREVTGFDPVKERAKLDQYCPVRCIPDDYPPILMIHGTVDTDVPYEESALMARELTRRKLPHELITVPNAGHGLSGGDKKLVAEAHERALEFIRKHLQ
jgi:acetyl esterase/lipase